MPNKSSTLRRAMQRKGNVNLGSDEDTRDSLKTLSTSTQSTWMLLLKSFNEKVECDVQGCDPSEIITNRAVCGVF